MQPKHKRLVFVTPTYSQARSKGYEVVIQQWIKILQPFFVIEVICLNKGDVSTINDCPVSYHYSGKFRRLLNLLWSAIQLQPFQSLLYFNNSAAKKITALADCPDTKFIFCTIRTHGLARYVDYDTRILLAIDSMELNLLGKYRNQKNFFIRQLLKIEYLLLKKRENSIVSFYKKAIFVAERDSLNVGADNSIAIPLSVDIPPLPEERSDKKEFIASLIGNFNYSPNINAAKYIINNVLPILPRDIQIQFIGFSAIQFSEQVSAYPNVVIKNDVASINRELMETNVALAPMQDGSGMQYKIIQAMALAVPVVTNSFGLGSIKATNGVSVMLCETPEELVDQLQTLKNDKSLCRAVGLNGRKLVTQYYSKSATTAQLLEVFK